MDSLESTLIFASEDFSKYKEIKSFVLNRYKNYKRQISFNSGVGMVSYADRLLKYYSTTLFSEDSEFTRGVAQRNIGTLSAYTVNDKDKEILAEILINTISNFEAVVVNGLLKSAIYTYMYTSSESTFNTLSEAASSLIIGKYINQETNYETFSLVFDQSKFLISEGKADLLFSTLLSVFAYVRKSLVLVARTYSSDKKLPNLTKKAKIGEFQNLVNALLDISLSDFYDTVKYIVNNMQEEITSLYKTDFLDQNIIAKIVNNFPSLFSDNRYSIEATSNKIILDYAVDIAKIQSSVILDTSNFSDFLDTIDDDELALSKDLLILEISNLFKG